MAEGYAKKLIKDYDLNDVTASSCGTFASSRYIVPKIVVKLLADEGIDASGHVSTPVNKELVEKSDLILAMTSNHLLDVISLFPSAKGKIHLFKAYAGSPGNVQDPMGRPDEVYLSCMNEIKECENKIFNKLFEKDKKNAN